ncbi:hypothetical protein [Gorillibacterium massiliense]|uniref:hypothetical protein n=1 Tax=Gorillibacterium massiliense TaxID=1280390 RepID=UPI0004BAC013|nr:hypothetical protein [Gorillibacterium massiliense]
MQWKNRGLGKNKNGLALNSNVFAKYILKRVHLVQLMNGQFFAYCFTEGVYLGLDERVLKAICRDILLEAEPDI